MVTVLWQSEDGLTSVESTDAGTFICLRFPLPRIAQKLRNSFSRSTTDAEMRVLPLLMENKTYKEIAADLGITKRTVAFHVSNLLRKFKVDNRRDLVLSTLASPRKD